MQVQLPTSAMKMRGPTTIQLQLPIQPQTAGLIGFGTGFRNVIRTGPAAPRSKVGSGMARIPFVGLGFSLSDVQNERINRSNLDGHPWPFLVNGIHLQEWRVV